VHEVVYAVVVQMLPGLQSVDANAVTIEAFFFRRFIVYLRTIHIHIRSGQIEIAQVDLQKK
jgi:hypothetical protein